MTGRFWFLGGTVDVKLAGHATEGRAAQLEFHDAEHQSPPLHVHTHEDELWAVLDGEITFFVGDEQYDLSAGEVAFGPRGVPHSYVVRSPTSRMLVTFAPAGIEEWFTRNGTPVATAAELPPPFDLDAAITTAGEYGLKVVGPPPVRTPRASDAVPSGTAAPEELRAWNLGIQAEFRANGGQVGGVFKGADLALLTTTGAKSGKDTTTPITYFRDGERILLIASNFGRAKHPAWFHNVRANPLATLEIGTETLTARATITEGDERHRLFTQVVAQQPGYAEYQKHIDRVIPVVAFEVVERRS
ncbi:nitroreductase/quinone reductase family protein [Streptomyces sp. NPDC048002]|uniref:nitroreductase/quinone reductase family protein n=1 Tax=Streptomyces sp. NPDC048002 TaxID=3154344 RepID=UPI0033C8D45D